MEKLQQATRAKKRKQTRDGKRPCSEQDEAESLANKKACANKVVHFRSLDKPKEDKFYLELSVLYSYDEVVERVALRLSLDDPSKIRLTAHDSYLQQPEPQPIKYRGVEHLTDMLYNHQTSNILYYEVSDIPLPELQGFKTLEVAFHHATKVEVVSHTIRLPMESTVRDAMTHLKRKVELSRPNAELRLLQVSDHKIYQIYDLCVKIKDIDGENWILRAEEVPEEEKNISSDDRLIHVFHFTKDFSKKQDTLYVGKPFLFLIRNGETLAEAKSRIQEKVRVSDKEFSKWRFAFLSFGRPEYLQDSDILSTFLETMVNPPWNEEYDETESASNKKTTSANKKEIQEDVDVLTVHRQYDEEPSLQDPYASFINQRIREGHHPIRPPIIKACNFEIKNGMFLID